MSAGRDTSSSVASSRHRRPANLPASQGKARLMRGLGWIRPPSPFFVTRLAPFRPTADRSPPSSTIRRHGRMATCDARCNTQRMQSKRGRLRCRASPVLFAQSCRSGPIRRPCCPPRRPPCRRPQRRHGTPVPVPSQASRTRLAPRSPRTSWRSPSCSA